jgi:hypothetical protein
MVVRDDVLLQLGKDGCPVVRPAARLSAVSSHVNVNAANGQRSLVKPPVAPGRTPLSSVGLAEEEVAPIAVA